MAPSTSSSAYLEAVCRRRSAAGVAAGTAGLPAKGLKAERAGRSPMNSEKRVTSGGHGAHLHKCPASPHGNYLPRLDSAHPPIEVKSFGEAT